MKTKRILSLLLAALMVCGALYLPEISAADDAPVVYLSMSIGSDDFGGTSPSAPVKTISEAFEKLAETGKGGTIVLMDGVNTRTSASANIIPLSNAGGTVTITSNYGGVDYRSTSNARLMLYYGLAFNNDVVFDGIDFLQITASTNRAVYLQHNDLTINENCATYKYTGTDYGYGKCPPKDESNPVAKNAGSFVIVTGYQSASSGSAINFGDQIITLNGARFGKIYVGNKKYAGADTTPTEQSRADIGNVWISVGDGAGISNSIDATTKHNKISTHVNLTNTDIVVDFNNGVDPSLHVTVNAEASFENLGFSLKKTEDGPAIGINESINVSFVDNAPVSEFGYAFMLGDTSPLPSIGAESAHRSYAYTAGESGKRNYQYAKGDEEALFKGILIYDRDHAKYNLNTAISAYPYAIDDTTGYAYVGIKQDFTLFEICEMIINDPEANPHDQMVALEIIDSALNYHVQRFEADPIPDATSSKVVYVSQNGHENGDGSSASSTVTFEEALGMTKNVVANSVVIVITDPVTLDPANMISTDPDVNDTGATSTDFVYYLPHTESNVTITSYYGGVNYASNQNYNAEIILKSDVAFYGDYTIKNSRIRNAADKSAKTVKDVLMFLQYNNVTLGSGLTCYNNSEGYGIGIICGYSSERAQWTTVEEISCREDASITVSSGTWTYIRGGNYRKNQYTIFGDIPENKKLNISITGGTFSSTTDAVSVTGMNSVHGEVYMEISGGTFNNPIYLISRAGSISSDTLAAEDLPVIDGKVTLKITGGTFNNGTMGTFWNTSNITVENSSDITLCIAGGTFTSNVAPKGDSNITCDRLVLPANGVSGISTSYTSGLTNTKNDSTVASITAPVLSSDAPEYSTPPSYDRIIEEGSNDPYQADTSNMGETTLEHLELLKKYYDRANSNHDNGVNRHIDDADYNFTGIESIEFVGMLSGEYSINKTITNYSIGGAGGGYMIDCGDFVLVAFGDTKAEDGTTGENGDSSSNEANVGGPWRANTLAFTEDFDYTDGILLDGFYMSDSGAGMNGTTANEFLISNHTPGTEQSKIPTGGMKIGDTLYFGYMSVRRWSTTGEDGIWKCNYGGLAISRDMGRTWETPSDLRWPEESGFSQLYPVLDGDWVYIFGVPGGRKGACKLMRVPAAEIENLAAYEYLVGYDSNGKGIFEKGEEAMMTEFNAIPEKVGGVGVMFNEYIGEWVIVYCSGSSGNITKNAIYMRSAANLNGKWSDPVVVISQVNTTDTYGFGKVYEPRICAKYQNAETGEMMLICSNWNLYNSMIFNVKLERRGNPVVDIIE